mmetsp:Transcript_23184/g.44158  ORF Transcript_23184/g.44158 Transcript_23184/m.44158 type:complete len:205 (-) Transcript_23184:1222-1836(-)
MRKNSIDGIQTPTTPLSWWAPCLYPLSRPHRMMDRPWVVVMVAVTAVEITTTTSDNNKLLHITTEESRLHHQYRHRHQIVNPIFLPKIMDTGLLLHHLLPGVVVVVVAMVVSLLHLVVEGRRSKRLFKDRCKYPSCQTRARLLATLRYRAGAATTAIPSVGGTLVWGLVFFYWRLFWEARWVWSCLKNRRRRLLLTTRRPRPLR